MIESDNLELAAKYINKAIAYLELARYKNNDEDSEKLLKCIKKCEKAQKCIGQYIDELS